MESPVDDWVDASVVLRPGVYALVYRGVVVYVGKSKAPLARIYTHRAQRGKSQPAWLPIKGITFDEIRVFPCRIEDLDKTEARFIARYRPRYNTQLRPPDLPPIRVAVLNRRV
jgi:excinuclease UvrABC nuclease subunit